MSPEDVQAAIAQGVSIVCATCNHFWEGVERNAPQCTAPSPCGSPIVGDVFSHYKGPITDFTRFCFVCGAPPAKTLKVENLVRLIGVCEKHREYLRNLRATAPGVRPIQVNTIDDRQDSCTPGEAEKPVKRDQNLGDLLAHIEAEEKEEFGE